MNKRIIGIVVSALVILGLVAVAWLWYLGRSTESGTPTASSSATSKVPTSVTGAGNGYSTNVSAGNETNPSTAGQGTLAGRITGGRYNTTTGTYTLSNGTYSAGAYTTPNGAKVSGGTYNPSNNTYTVGGGTYNVSDGSYTAGTGTIVNYEGSPSGTNATSSLSSAGNNSNSNNTNTPTGGNPTFSTTTTDATGNTPTAVDPGVTWVPNADSNFDPTAINSIRDANASGTGAIFLPHYLNTDSISNDKGPDALLTSLTGLGISALACSGFLGMRTPALPAGVTAAGAVTAASTAAIPLSVPDNSVAANLGISFIAGATVARTTYQTADESTDFWSCLTRAIAKQLLAQMTRDIVNWINGGFNGQPAFIQNQQAFLANAANQAAGQAIAGSGLAFLCSPFQLQVRIALAQAYASRNAAPACTLSGVINNVNGFFNGNFGAGGWPGILSVTTMPQNNAFGAYAAGQVQVASRVALATQQNADLISPTGFVAAIDLNLQAQSCATSDGLNTTYASSANGKVPCPPECSCKIQTPGQVISDSLAGTNKSTFDSLNMAKNFDEIIGALINQLIQKTLYNGLSHLSDNGGYGGSGAGGATQNPGSTQAASLLASMQQSVYTVQQYGGLQQGMITDVQNAQSQLNTLLNCWGAIATTSSPFNDSQKAAAETQAQGVQSQIDSLQRQVDTHNAEITRGNDMITTLEQLETSLLNASGLQDVQNVQAVYDATTFISSSDLANAQLDRVTLQSQMSTLNRQTSDNLTQCRATIPPSNAGTQ